MSGIVEWFNIGKSANVIHHINKMRDKKHMNFLIDGEKTIWKIPYVFITETLKKLGKEGNYLYRIKITYEKATADSTRIYKRTVQKRIS